MAVYAHSLPMEWETKQGKFHLVLFSTNGKLHRFTVSKLINNRWKLFTHVSVPDHLSPHAFVDQWRRQHTGFKGGMK